MVTMKRGYLDGQLLVAMPGMSDPRFARSLIYLCAHSDEGAMGLIVNQRAPHISFAGLIEQLAIKAPPVSPASHRSLSAKAVHVGGPVDTARGFVLHSSDYYTEDGTVKIGNGISLTATIDVLRAIALGQGPRRSILALGYAGWAPGQLETEIHANGWLHCPLDLDLVFDEDVDSKYERAMAKIGVNPSHLVNTAGHA